MLKKLAILVTLMAIIIFPACGSDGGGGESATAEKTYTEAEIRADWDFLPANPDPARNNKSQEGIDSNGVGGRDDAEIAAAMLSYPDKTKFRILSDIAQFHREEILAEKNKDGDAYYNANKGITFAIKCYGLKYDASDSNVIEILNKIDGVEADRGYQSALREMKMQDHLYNHNPTRSEVEAYFQEYYSK